MIARAQELSFERPGTKGKISRGTNKEIEIKQAILDAAYELFSKHGYSDTNITDIARSAGVARQMFMFTSARSSQFSLIYEPWLISNSTTWYLAASANRGCLRKIRHCLAHIPSADNGLLTI